MKVLLLGVGGMGTVTVLDLLERPEVTRIIAADSDERRLNDIHEKAKSNRLTTVKADVTDVENLASLMKEVDVVANATWFHYNLAVQSAACAARRNLVDLGGLYHMTLRQLEHDMEAKDAGITCLIGCGAAPGLTNIVAAYGASKMDTLEEIKISEARIDKHQGPNPTHSIKSIIFGWTTPAVIYENGQYREIPPLTVKERVSYPGPLGELEHYYYVHSELATLPKFLAKSVKRVIFLNSHPEMEQLKSLLDLGLINYKTGNEPFHVGNATVTPHEFLEAFFAKSRSPEVKAEEWWAFRVQLKGRKNRESVEYVYHSVIPSYIKWNARVVAYVTGTSLSVGVQMLGKGEVKAKGVLPPEACLQPTTFLKAMGERGIRIQETTDVHLDS